METNPKLAKDLEQAKARLAALETKRGEVAGQLHNARQALERAESEHEAALASAGLGEDADLVRARKALDAAREGTAKLEAALRRLERDTAAAQADVQACERAIAQDIAKRLDAQLAALCEQAAKDLGALWQTLADLRSDDLVQYDRMKARHGVRIREDLARVLMAVAREAHGQLIILEQADPAGFGRAGVPTRQERERRATQDAGIAL
ncbi:MAG: hypothetical protein Kow00123_12070 [Anaerolineales bacterium]